MQKASCEYHYEIFVKKKAHYSMYFTRQQIHYLLTYLLHGAESFLRS